MTEEYTDYVDISGEWDDEKKSNTIHNLSDFLRRISWDLYADRADIDKSIQTLRHLVGVVNLVITQLERGRKKEHWNIVDIFVDIHDRVGELDLAQATIFNAEGKVCDISVKGNITKAPLEQLEDAVREISRKVLEVDRKWEEVR